MIAVCSRLNLCGFNAIVMNLLPLAPKKSRGRMKKRNPALLRDGEVERYALDNDLTVKNLLLEGWEKMGQYMNISDLP